MAKEYFEQIAKIFLVYRISLFIKWFLLLNLIISGCNTTTYSGTDSDITCGKNEAHRRERNSYKCQKEKDSRFAWINSKMKQFLHFPFSNFVVVGICGQIWAMLFTYNLSIESRKESKRHLGTKNFLCFCFLLLECLKIYRYWLSPLSTQFLKDCLRFMSWVLEEWNWSSVHVKYFLFLDENIRERGVIGELTAALEHERRLRHLYERMFNLWTNSPVLSQFFSKPNTSIINPAIALQNAVPPVLHTRGFTGFYLKF